MRHTITKQFIVHLVRIESLGESCCYSRHVFEEAFPILVCQLVELFVMPFEGDERVAFEELVRVELANRCAGFEEDEVCGFAESFANPTIRC
jgi:hypothetical protein